MASPAARTRARLADWERLEDRDQPSAGLLANIDAVGAPSLAPFTPGGGAVVNGRVFFTAADGAATAGLYSSDGTAAGTTKVADITPQTPTPVPTGYVGATPVAAAGGRVYFSRTDAAGAELWASDGTTAGTGRVADLMPGTEGSNPSEFIPLGGRLVFSAAAPTPGQFVPSARVWFGTDGTAAGTQPLFPPGTPSPYEPAATGGKVFFAATENSPLPSGRVTTIWSSDGTAAGTKPFVTLPEEVLPQSYSPGWAAWLNGKLYFSASDGAAGDELWVSDGTAAGTHVLKDINSGTHTEYFPGDPGGASFSYPLGSSPRQFTPLNGAVYFVADDGDHGQELWRTDGTADGTTLVADISPEVAGPESTFDPASGSHINGLTAAGGRLYFAADDNTHGRQFYTSDGTAAGTVALTSVPHPGSDGSVVDEQAGVLGQLGGKVLFSFADQSGVRQLWATDGTPAGTAVVLSAAPSASPFARYLAGPAALGAAGGVFLFSWDDGTAGRQLWVTDGTAVGTRMLARLNPSDLPSAPSGFLSLGANAMFAASPGPGFTGVYGTDGTDVRLLKKLGAAANVPAGWSGPVLEMPAELTRSGNKGFFVVRAGSVGWQLWATDGTVGGTALVKEVPLPWASGTYSGWPLGITNLADAGGTLFFTTDLPGSGQQLWKTDGTAAGTKLVATVNVGSQVPPGPYEPGPRTDGALRQLTAAGGKVFFTASSDGSGEELWVSDGTAAGTRMVKDIATPDPADTYGDLGSHPDDLTAFNGKLYFTADDRVHGRQLWVSDGTAAGTKIAATITTGDPPQVPWLRPQYSGDPGPRELIAAGGKLFAVGFDPVHGRQLWATDGTQAGTTRLTDTGVYHPALGPNGTKDSGVSGLTAVGAKVYFVAGEETSGRQLWVSDGTPGGTKMVKAITPAQPGKYGPWAAGPGWQAVPGQNDPVVLTAIGDRVVFSADDGATGRELWVTDGTAAGTRRLTDLAPGKYSGLGTLEPYTPADTAAVVGGRLVFAGDDGPHGREPWTMPVSEIVPPTVPPITPPPPVTPPTTTGRAAVSRTFAVGATEDTPFTANLAAVTLPAGPTYRATVFWGDGRTSAATLTPAAAGKDAFLISASHTYAEPGSYKVMVRVTADYKTVLSIDATAAVADARFYVGRVADRVTAGVPFAGPVATIADLNPTGGKADDYSATIDWGDGKTSAGTVRRVSSGRFAVDGSHTFDAPGRRTVTVTIKATAGGTATAASVFVIDPPAARLGRPA